MDNFPLDMQWNIDGPLDYFMVYSAFVGHNLETKKKRKY
jgi:hypothetical protein